MITTWNFVKAVADRSPDEQQQALDLLPSILTLACRDVMPIAGAGLSVISDLRLPLGSSDATATFMEQLQFTGGAGPCIEAAESGEASVNDEERIATRWPAFHIEMTTRTPYRSTLSLPVNLGGFTGALDLYSVDPSAVSFPPIDELAAAVVQPIRLLTADPPMSFDRLGIEMPAWLNQRSVDIRLNIWIAVGRLMEFSGLSGTDCVASLRAWAFSHGRTLDEVGTDLVERKLAAAEVVQG